MFFRDFSTLMTSWRLFRGGNRGKSVSRKCGAKTNHKNRFEISFDDIKDADAKINHKNRFVISFDDIEGANAKTNQKKRFVIFSMISRVPMKTGKLEKNWDLPQAQVDDKVFQQSKLLVTIGMNLTCTGCPK